jgi:hypothetical protein
VHSLSASIRFIELEARALLTRLGRVKSFALQLTSVPAAAVTPAAQTGIERLLSEGKRELRERMCEFLRWLGTADARRAGAAEAQKRFTILRLRFNQVLSHVDLFADALVQRSEHEYGTWLGGLDVAAADALALPGVYEAPPLICYLDRGAGAAIRRARTRLPGGGDNPVAVVRVPRERMVGSGVASSLFHEVGHQGAALLDLVNELRPALRERQRRAGRHAGAWASWERWISEIVADLWSMAKLGITATNGLLAVVSLPRAFVFRDGGNDPHPFPWIRVMLGCALGRAIHPDPQWDALEAHWLAFYPTAGLDAERGDKLHGLRDTLPDFAALLARHQPAALGGRTLVAALGAPDRQPARLRTLWKAWRREPDGIRAASPSLAFAVIGQARWDGALSPEEESEWLGRLLTFWALRGTIDLTELCADAIRGRQTLSPATQN